MGRGNLADIMPKVLVIDDERNVLRAVERVLRRDGYEVLLADSGPAALKILAGTLVAVIICDQRMPAMTGDEVLAKAAAMQPEAFRITLTGQADLSAARKLINAAGVNRYLCKPWNDEDLRQAVRAGVERCELARENCRLLRVTREQNLKLDAWNKELEQRVRQRTEELHRQNETLQTLQRELQKSLKDTVGILAGMLEAISPSLGTHCRRVARLACEIGQRLKVAPEELRDIEFSALLHDIGLVSHVYRDAPHGQRKGLKPSELRSRHPESGAAILSHIEGFDRIVLAVQHQLEHFDGSGWPDGQSGSSIPLASRIIAAANAYDEAAFQDHDPSHPALEAGRQMLIQGEDRRFDPMVVRALLESVEATLTDAAGEIEMQLSPRQLRPQMVLSRPVCTHKGVLLLQKGTVLTPPFIERIQQLSDVDPLLTDVYVLCRATDVEGHPPPASPTVPAADSSSADAVMPEMTLRSGPASEAAVAASFPSRSDAGLTTPSVPEPLVQPPALRDAASDEPPMPAHLARDAASDEPPMPAHVARDAAPAAVERPSHGIDGAGTSVGAAWLPGGPGAALGEPMTGLDSAEATSAQPPPLPEHAPTHAPRPRVLIVDDDPSVCSALQRELRLAGYDSICANGGSEALSLLESHRPDVALTDLAMPDIPGEDLVLLFGRRAPEMPCIVVSGNTSYARVKKLAGLPTLAGVLVKPWSHERLLQTLEAALAGAATPRTVRST